MERKTQSDVSITTPVRVMIQQETEKQPPQKFWTNDRIADGVKWLTGTVFLGLLGWYTNYQIKSTELEIQNRIKDRDLALQGMEIDSKLINAVSAKFDTSKTVQLNYLNFVQPFITTDSIKVAVQRLILALGKQVESHVTDSLTDAQEAIILKAKSQLSANEKRELQVQAAHVPSTQQPIASYKKEMATLSENKTTISDSLVSLNIQKAKILSTPKVEYNYILQRPPETKWCKKGYFVEFNNTLRIGVNDLDRDRMEINLKRLTGDDAEPIQAETIVLKSQTSIQIDDGDLRYKISLDYIGAAGKNPFTRAAYITVASYKK